ncbi:MAG: tRNA (guanosine(37)-N1)-methyltransferase TrmD [Spirochaetaceae bacterium]|nr:MAG: tRNA (guanosine(37)-N1)-methyltransferase TrmD [Spirochaetaceae bacterium]
MRFTLLTLFPEPIDAYFASSIMARAVQKGLVQYRCVNIRDFALDTHRTCDDAPYGGGAGMVLKAEPLAAALDSVGAAGLHTIYPTPAGRSLTTALVEQLGAHEELVLICGRYEGIDQRVIDLYVDDEISIGDYVLSSGELAALVIVDVLYRHLDGVITRESLQEESFQDGLLEYPHYTRPEVFRSRGVPEVLLSGHHERIREWRTQQRIDKTRRARPDLYEAWLSRSAPDGKE